MIKKHWKLLLLTSIVIVLPILAGVILWDQLPAQIPSHWNASGEVDGWSSKTFGVFGMPLFLLALHWLCILATCADPKKNHHPDKILQLVFWIVPIVSVGAHAMVYSAALGKEVNVNAIMPVVLGLLFVIIGNYLPKCKQNYTIGIKIPWTLDSEENWNKTHRIAGKLWVVCGLIIMMTGFFGGLWILIPVMLLMVLVPLAYSYMIYRKEQQA